MSRGWFRAKIFCHKTYPGVFTFWERPAYHCHVAKYCSCRLKASPCKHKHTDARHHTRLPMFTCSFGGSQVMPSGQVWSGFCTILGWLFVVYLIYTDLVTALLGTIYFTGFPCGLYYGMNLGVLFYYNWLEELVGYKFYLGL